VIDRWHADEHLETLLLGVATVFLIWIGMNTPRPTFWRFLAVIFGVAFLAKASGALVVMQRWTRRLDSAEAIAGPLTSSLLSLVGAVLVTCLLVIVFYRWVCTLEARIRWRMMLAGACYVAGAVGVEAVTEWCWATYGSNSLQYIGTTLVEECLEIGGLLLFIDATNLQRLRLRRPEIAS